MTRWNVRRSLLVERDLLDCIDFIARQSPAQARRFLAAFDALFDQLAEFPERAQIRVFPRSGRIHQRALDGFPNHLAFYIVDETRRTVTIARLLHGARDLNEML